MKENEIGDVIIASAMKVHSAVGPGLLETAYETCLLYELEKQGLSARRQERWRPPEEVRGAVRARADVGEAVGAGSRGYAPRPRSGGRQGR